MESWRLWSVNTSPWHITYWPFLIAQFTPLTPMEDVQSRRRQAAIRASTNLVESSSDESRRSGNKDGDYHCTPRRSKSAKIKAYQRRIPQAVNVVFADTSVKRRRRASTIKTQVQRKRQRGAVHNVVGIPGGNENLTPVTLVSWEPSPMHCLWLNFLWSLSAPLELQKAGKLVD